MRSSKPKKQINKKKLFTLIGISILVIVGIVFGILGLIKITNKGDSKLTEPSSKPTLKRTVSARA